MVMILLLGGNGLPSAQRISGWDMAHPFIRCLFAATD
jgi:hypothetical protein